MSIVWAGKYLEAHVEGRWEFVARTRDIGAAVILALTEAREVVLVEQWRAPLGCPCIEFPAGLVGDGGAETAAASAARELAEETGFEAARWEDLGAFATSAGMSRETFRLFRATGLTRTGAGGGVDGEAIIVHVVPLAGLAAWLAGKRGDGCAVDGRLVAVLALV